MLSRPERKTKLVPKQTGIDEYMIRLLIGLVAISIPFFPRYISNVPITSISASYHVGGWARDIFVGSLYVIFALLLSYNGRSLSQMFHSKIAAVAALCVAMFPCKCGSHPEIIPNFHGISACIMFLILVYFCWEFFRRARSKNTKTASFRAIIYVIMGAIIIASIFILLINHFLDDQISTIITRLTYYCETAALVAFGIAWFTASQLKPIIKFKEYYAHQTPGT
jgi:hypothetical protein